ncbi:hypothetical protein L0F63_001468, partial [Massospora cicadina]
MRIHSFVHVFSKQCLGLHSPLSLSPFPILKNAYMKLFLSIAMGQQEIGILLLA